MSDAEATDDELVGLVARGDKAAFARIVARHQPRLVALVARSLGSRAAAEDIVQEVFTRAWVKAPLWQVRDPGEGEPRRASYAAWLSRIAVNLSIDQVRKVRPTTLDAVEEPADPALPADAAIIARERAARVKTAIAALPERQRMAIGLTYDAEMSNADGAVAMGVTVGAFELLLVRARRTLRQSLRQSLGDE